MKCVYFNRHYKNLRKDNVFYASNIVNSRTIIDRTGNNNIINLDYVEIPKDTKTNMTFEECCMKRAKEIIELNKFINVMWSGGIDSTSLLISLLEQGDVRNQIKINLTKSSIDEFPEFFDKVVKKLNYEIYEEEELIHKDRFLDKDTIYLNGECGDQLFGSDSLANKEELMKNNWEEILFWKNNFLLSKQNYSDEFYNKIKSSMFNFIFEHIEYSPIKITTIFDFYWWMNFSLKWMDVIRRIPFIMAKSTDYENHLAFYNTEYFQKWSITNHDLKIENKWNTYKQPAKNFIHKYFPNEMYRKNKLKVPSLYLNIDSYNNSNICLCLNNGESWKMFEEIPNVVLINLKI